jgi:hypothetical protein
MLATGRRINGNVDVLGVEVARLHDGLLRAQKLDRHLVEAQR